jgi:hypothetical protein
VGQSDGRPSSTNTEAGEAEPVAAPTVPTVPTLPTELPSPTQPTSPKSPRAASPMSRTLLTGVALQSTWRLPGLSENSSQPPVPASEPDGSGVRKLVGPTDAATVDAAAEASAQAAADNALTSFGLADTQRHARREPPASRAALNPKLARTLRMEIGISARPEPEQAPPPPAAAREATEATEATRPPAARKLWDEPVVPGATQRIGTRDSDAEQHPTARNTDPFGRAVAPKAASRRPKPAGPRQPAAQPYVADAQPPLQLSAERQAELSSQAASYWNGAEEPPRKARRAPRAGEQTVLTRRRGTSTRDWLFVGLMVCALGVTASLLLSYGTHSTRESAESAATTVEHAVNPPVEAAPTPQAGEHITQIVSTPPGAEVVAGGAVIGNTPVSVVRSTMDTDYLVRLAGHEPQLVRVMAASPTTIAITLKPIAR